MQSRLMGSKLAAALLLGVSAPAFAQGLPPGAEIAGQSMQVTTNGITNTVYLDPNGAARIVSPNGKIVNATWTAAGQQLCLNAGGATECWPYTQAFRAGQSVTLMSNCNATSTWLANAVNQPPSNLPMGERG